MTEDDDEICEQPFPSLEEMRPHIGKVVAFDDEGRIHESADSWEEIYKRLGDRRQDLTLMYIPAYAIGGPAWARRP